MLIDNRGNSPSDISEAIAVSVFGTVVDVGSDADSDFNIYLKKHGKSEQFPPRGNSRDLLVE